MLTLDFIDDDQFGDALGQACTGLFLLPPAVPEDSSVFINQTARGFSVLDNDFPEQGVVTWAQRNTFLEEGSNAVELRLMRLSRADSYDSANVFDPDWIYSYGQRVRRFISLRDSTRAL